MRYKKSFCNILHPELSNRKLTSRSVEVSLRQFLLLLLAGCLGATNILAEPIVLDQGTPVSLLSVQHQTDETVLIALGELAFKNKSLLDASNSFGLHMSCDACHPDGGTTQSLFVEGLSGKPGTIDITNRAMTLYEDGSFNPVNIPSIFGARHTEPYARSGKFSTLREFTRFVVVDEFGGLAPGDLTLDALVAYERSLNFLDNRWIDDKGALVAGTPSAARRGETIFNEPFPSQPGLTCATCHNPETSFVDGNTRSVGTGVTVDTPTLRDLTISAPYMHDGRFDSLLEVVEHFDKYYELNLSNGQKDDLVSYLKVVGGGELPKFSKSSHVHLDTVFVLLNRTLRASDWALGKMVIAQVLIELNVARDQANPPSREIIDRVFSDISRIDAYNKVENYTAALAILDNLSKVIVR